MLLASSPVGGWGAFQFGAIMSNRAVTETFFEEFTVCCILDDCERAYKLLVSLRKMMMVLRLSKQQGCPFSVDCYKLTVVR